MTKSEAVKNCHYLIAEHAPKYFTKTKPLSVKPKSTKIKTENLETLKTKKLK